MKSETDVLLEKISTGEITNWFQVEIESSLLGIKIDSEFIRRMIKCGDNFDENPKRRMRRYVILYKTLMDSDILDHFFEDCVLVREMIECDGTPIYYDWMVLNDEEKPDCKNFRALQVLKKIDSRNPRYMLKFFLNSDGTTLKMSSFMFLLEDIIIRTFKRYKMLETEGNNEISEKFYGFYKKLWDKKEEFYERNRMMS